MSTKDKKSFEELADRFGNIIKVGSYIVYGNNLGRCAKTAIGQVVALYETKSGLWDKWEMRMTVNSLQDDVGYWAKSGGKVKKVTLLELERVILYDGKLLPKKIKDKLAEGPEVKKRAKPRNRSTQEASEADVSSGDAL